MKLGSRKMPLKVEDQNRESNEKAETEIWVLAQMLNLSR